MKFAFILQILQFGRAGLVYLGNQTGHLVAIELV